MRCKPRAPVRCCVTNAIMSEQFEKRGSTETIAYGGPGEFRTGKIEETAVERDRAENVDACFANFVGG